MTSPNFDERESGMAMITALIVCMIVMFLGITAVALSDHTLGTQRVDRKRIATFHAAEAGVDHALEVLQSTALASLPCDAPLASSLGSGVGAADYSVTFAYYDASGTQLGCPLASSPASVLLTSIGDSSDPVGSRREVQVTAQLDPPTSSTGLDKVIFSEGDVDFSNNVQIDGYIGNDAIVYTNGDYSCSNSQQLVGAVYAPQGSATMSNQCGVRGDVWVRDAVSMSGSATVGRDVVSSTSSIAMTGNQNIVRRNARAATTITTSGSATIQGLRIPSSPTPTPPASTYPQVPYTQAAWVAAGYTIRSYTNCALAETELKTLASTWTSPTLMRITGCKLTVGNNSTINTANNLAIVSDLGIELNNLSTWNVGGTAPAAGTFRELHLIVPYGSTCPADINLGGHYTVAANLATFVYTPCVAKLANNGKMFGQFYGGDHVDFTGPTWVAYRPVSGVPGFSPTLSTTIERQVSVLYKREVASP